MTIGGGDKNKNQTFSSDKRSLRHAAAPTTATVTTKGASVVRMQPDNICNCVDGIAVELPFGFLHTGDDNHDIIAGIREYIPSTTCWPGWLSAP